MLCLGVETSCDETALALLRRGRVLGHELASQADVHALFGGVVPEIASREHYRLLPRLCARVLAEAEGGPYAPSDLDVVAVARGPGLLGALLVGLGFAKGLTLGTGARLVGVDHLLAHLLAADMQGDMAYPALGLLVSGGHTNLYLMRSPLDAVQLGRTLDDAAGEAYDKVAKMLNLPYPGGRCIDELAAHAAPDTAMFPRPYLDNQNLDFSFSGLKTAVGALLDKRRGLRIESPSGALGEGFDAGALAAARPELATLCSSFNHTVADTLRVKMGRALQYLSGGAPAGFRAPETGPVRTLLAAGGVAANSAVRAMLQALAAEHGLAVRLPEPALCTDNGVMIAHAGSLLAAAGLEHGPDLEAVPRGRRTPWDYRRCTNGKNP